MGAKHSQPQPPDPKTIVGSDESFSNISDGSMSPNNGNTKTKRLKSESAYAKARRKCHKKKLAYDGCYQAQLSSKDEDCGDLFNSYRECFVRVMAKDMERRGVKVNEGSMIKEYYDVDT